MQKRGHVSSLEKFVTYLRACYAPLVVSTIRVTTDSGACLSGSLDHSAAAVVIGDQGIGDLLTRYQLSPAFRGWSPDGEHVAILDRHPRPLPHQAPPWFRAIAIVPVFNEADVIEHTLEYLIAEGIAVHVIDNWSTDATPRILQQFEASGKVTVERFPCEPAE